MNFISAIKASLLNSVICSYPQRIICLTEETTETLYLLGEQDRIVGISGYTVRPPEARQSKPKVSAFINAKFDKIMSLEPDLVFAFSDLQADIAAELIKRGVNVMAFNQRSVTEIFQMILCLSRIVGVEDKGIALVEKLQSELDLIRASALRFPNRKRVLFEEWYDPIISGIRWVDELIEIAGGEPIFPELRTQQAAKDRIVSYDEIIKRNPDVIIGSWCGRQVKKDKIREREGFQNINAVCDNHLYEVKSTYILQPGPASLTEGVRQIHKILAHVHGLDVDERIAPQEKIDKDISSCKK
jgi:iron complex transport system substrate-binding protein